jgi:hypothetical protein
VGTRLTPHPVSLPPETGEIDESWEDLVIGALGTDPPAESDAGVFDRPTAVPAVRPSGLELDLSSLPRDLTPHTAPTVTPKPGSELTLEPDSRLTARLPLPGPARGALAADGPALPVAERAHGSGPLEVSLEPEGHSPLDLVETYRRSVASMPAVRVPGAEPPGETSRESGNLQDMQDRYAVGDFTGALVVAESLLEADPEDEDAKRYAQSCREVLTQMYAARIGPMDQVATVAVPPEQITWLSLDHRAGFLLSLVDGVSSIEEILDISGMTRLDALRIMYTLVQQNVITLTH